jgi:hypothetical protein
VDLSSSEAGTSALRNIRCRFSFGHTHHMRRMAFQVPKKARGEFDRPPSSCQYPKQGILFLREIFTVDGG